MSLMAVAMLLRCQTTRQHILNRAHTELDLCFQQTPAKVHLLWSSLWAVLCVQACVGVRYALAAATVSAVLIHISADQRQGVALTSAAATSTAADHAAARSGSRGANRRGDSLCLCSV